MKVFFVLIAGIFFISCRQQFPSGILPPDKMKLVFYDYLSADIYVSEYLAGDSATNEEEVIAEMQQQVFRKHKVTREEFFKSYRYYVAHPDQMKAVIDSMAVPKIKKKPDTKFKSRSLKKLKVYDQDI